MMAPMIRPTISMRSRSSRWPRSTSSLRRTCSFTRRVSSSSSMTTPYSIRIEPSKDFMNKESDFDPRNPDHLLAVCAATYGTIRFSDIPFQVALVYRMCLRCRSSGHVHLYDDGNGRALCQTCMHKLEGKRRLKDAKLLETERKRRVSRQRAKYLDSLAEVILAAENVHADIKNRNRRKKTYWKHYYETEYPSTQRLVS